MVQVVPHLLHRQAVVEKMLGRAMAKRVWAAPPAADDPDTVGTAADDAVDRGRCDRPQLHLQLRGQGTAIPTNDLWIAALVVQHGLILCTSDRHCRHLAQVVTC